MHDKFLGWQHLSPDEKKYRLDNLLPEHDYIAVFGTSHTFGSCQHQGKIMIPESHNWTNVLEKNLGMPVLNMGYPGIDNETLVDMLGTFLELPRSQYCRYVLMESRFGEASIKFGLDVFPGFPENFVAGWNNQNPLTEDLVSTKFFSKGVFHDQIPQNEAGTRKTADGFYFESWRGSLPPVDVVYKQPVTIDNNFLFRLALVSDNKRMREILEKNRSTWNNADDEYIDQMMIYKKSLDKFERTSLSSFFRDYRYMRLAGRLCKYKGIPFNWFCWDAKPDIQKAEEVSDQFWEKINRELPDFNQYEIEKFNKGATVAYLMEHKELPEKCECGHNMPPTHKYVAENIEQAIRGKL